MRNTSILTCSGDKDDLSLVTVNPTVENTHSAGVDVAGTVMYFLATLEIMGKQCLFSFYHLSGDSSLSNGLSCK